MNRAKKYLGVFDENKVETRIPIADVTDITRPAQADSDAGGAESRVEPAPMMSPQV